MFFVVSSSFSKHVLLVSVIFHQACIDVMPSHQLSFFLQGSIADSDHREDADGPFNAQVSVPSCSERDTRSPTPLAGIVEEVAKDEQPSRFRALSDVLAISRAIKAVAQWRAVIAQRKLARSLEVMAQYRATDGSMNTAAVELDTGQIVEAVIKGPGE